MKKSSNNIYSCAGISKVFAFTITQTFKNRAYRLSFIIFVVMMMTMGPLTYLGAAAGMGAAESSEAIHDEMDLKNIYFVNETLVPFSSADAELDNTGFAVAALSDAEAVPEKLADDEIAVLIDRQSIDGADTYVINAIVSDESNISGSELEALCELLLEQFTQARRDAADLGEEQMAVLQKAIQTGGVTTYEEYEAKLNSTYTDSQLQTYNSMYSIVLMILVALTGSFVVSSVMEEKTSKLVENLMVSVRPLALIMGKILAMMCYVFLMIVLGVGGSYITNGIAASLVGSNAAMEAGVSLDFAKLFTFAGPKALLMLPCMILTYFMYSILAGLLGSGCTKIEDAASATGTVTMINMIGYMVGMILPMMASSKPVVATVASIIPFVSSYMAPVCYICGRIPLWAFLLGILLQAIVCVVLFLICAKTYRKLIVNDSKKFKLFDIIKLAIAKEA